MKSIQYHSIMDVIIKFLVFLIFLIIPSNRVLRAQATSFLPLNDRYALVIGISSYQDNKNNLQYARKDAEDFYKVLKKYGRFKEENIILLVDNNANREGIRKNIEGWLRNNTKESDLVIIFFSGHGSQIDDLDGDEIDSLDECLLPYDYNSKDYSSVIVDDLFAYWIRNLRSNKILIIFDNCYSGGAAKQKGILMPGMKGGIVKDAFSPDIFREVPKKGTALIAACKADQISFESDSLCNGLFTYFLINSIDSKTDNDFNNIIDAQELFYSTRKKTLTFSTKELKRKQEPIFINQIKDKLDLFYLPIEKPKESNKKKINELLYKAKKYTFKDSKKCIEILEEAYKLDPTNIDINKYLADEYERIGDFEKAIYYYSYIYSEKKSGKLIGVSFFPSIPSRIGSIYQKKGELDKALSWYLKAAEENPYGTRRYSSIADIYLYLNDTLSAIENLNSSIKAKPLQKNAYLKLFYIYLFQNKFSMAYKFIQDCHKINPNDFETIYWFGTFEKYYKKNSIFGDSLLTYFELNSGIKTVKDELMKKSDIDYISITSLRTDSITIIKGDKVEKHLLDKAISQYPYYKDFYKMAIIASSKNKTINKSDYSSKYLEYSKINPDTLFINKYLSN